MVFQNYALYPSMTVYENMAFGLKMRSADRKRINEQVQWAADIMEISDLLNRYPNQLSGGQQQRVALGRAIVRDPALFLLDEPLSNLDAKLRAVMRTEIQELQEELGVATVFVTHDQEEAMSMGDRIAVMNAGQIQQIDDPETIYHDPNSLFVADFIGSPAINFFTGTVADDRITTDEFSITLPDAVADELHANHDEEEIVLGIRPENLYITDHTSDSLVEVDVEVVEPMGDTKIVYFDLGNVRINMVVPSTVNVEKGDRIGVGVEWPNVHLFSLDGPKILKWMHAVGRSTAPDSSSEAATDGGERRDR
jgi:multiple sugar transport system ATP-binding protein